MNSIRIKVISIVFTIIFVISLSPASLSFASVIDYGMCGRNVYWTLDDSGVLTIEGSGEMENFGGFCGFYGREDIKSVVFSGNITTISQSCFERCSNLSSITIPNTITIIEEWAFRQCTSLTRITIPNSVTNIGEGAFWGSGLTSITIPSSVNRIEDNTFRECSKLTSVSIPSGVSYIGHNAFAATSISYIDIPDSVSFLGDCCFCNCKNLTSIAIPEGVTEIGSGTFSGCTNLYNVNLPDSVVTIGNQSFEKCTSLVNIDIPNSVTYIENGAFDYCINLTSVVIPDSVLGIASSTFSRCNSLNNIYISKNLKYIEEDGSLFYGCSSLTDVYFGGTRKQYESIKGIENLYNESVTIHYSTNPVSISLHPKDYIGEVGKTALFTVTAQGIGLKYQWQTYNNGAWKNSSLPGYNTATLSVPITASRNGYKFRCVVKGTNTNTVTSNPAILYVVNSPISITTQPKDYTGAVGSTATFKVVAQGTGLKYQWQTYSNGAWKNSSLPGYNTTTLSVPVVASRNGYKFRCVVTDATNKTATSNAVILKITSAATVSITTQPKDYTGSVGSTARFKVVAQGTGLKYQWQTYSNGAWKNSSLPGYNTATLSVPVIASRNGYKFRCVVTDATNKTATSNTVTLHITASAAVSITTQPKDYTGAVGSTATFKVVAQGTGLRYQWQTYSNGAWRNSSLPGYNTATLSVPVIASRNGYKFRCVVTDSSNKTVTSNTAVLRVAT